MTFTIGFIKKGLANRFFLLHVDANSQGHTVLGNSLKPNADHAALLTHREKRALPPQNLEGPCCEVLSMNSGVSISQATPFLSSPGAMICRALLPTATDLDCSGLRPGSPEQFIQS